MEYQIGGIQGGYLAWGAGPVMLVTYQTAMRSQITDFIQVSTLTFPPCGSGENPDSS